jgi:hypothetical protein
MKPWIGSVVMAAVVLPLGAEEPEARSGLKRSLEVLRAVGPNGKGSKEAARAWQDVSRADVGQLPQLLAAMDGANALARNWLRSAIDRVLERARRDKKDLPQKPLETFLRNRRHDPQARRFAYELVLEKDKTAADRFLPGMLDDPSLELRRDAVARLLDQAQKRVKDNKDQAIPLFEKALAAARDLEQVSAAARALGELGKPVDMAKHLGLIPDWKVIGPFDNQKQKGVDTAYPPEKKIDLSGEYAGKAGKVRWTAHVSKDRLAVVDLHAILGKQQEAVAYAVTEFTTKAACDVEIRLGCYTAFKMWVNGKLVLVRGDAFTGMSLDHYVAQVRLKKGKNVILLKVCQDLLPPAPVPHLWRFQLRVSDASGAAIHPAARSEQRS